jgi:hypothetical protein
MTRSTPRHLRSEHLDFIARIYDCLLEPAAWRGVLDELSAFTGAVSIPTIRTQIKQVLAKTGTHSRPALVRLALSVNLPVDPADG